MRSSTSLVALVAGVSAVSAQALQGFNYGATNSDGSIKDQQRYADEFKVAKQLVGTSGWASARLYTSIQGGTANTPNSAIPAAIAEDTTLLLGIWCSGGQDVVTNEIAAIQAAIEQYGDEFTSRVTGLSVGSEDLYRISPTGVAANSGYGAGPEELVKYINQAREALKGTALENVKIGHVDTWNDWVNGSNAAVVEAVDWVGFDGYPYFQSTVANSIDDAEALFDESYAATVAAAQGKDVWVTETGWPVSGPEYGQAVASLENARKYWEKVACKLIGKVNTYWYTLQDAYPTTPSPSFGVVGTELSNTPLYDLSCPADGESSSSSSAASSSAAATSSGAAGSSEVDSVTATATGSVTATYIEGSEPTNTDGEATTVDGSIIYVPSVTRIVSLESSTAVASPTAPNTAVYPPAGTGAVGTGAPGYGQGGNGGAAGTGGNGGAVPTGGPGGGSVGGGGGNGGNGTAVTPTAPGYAGGTNVPIAPTSSQFLGAAAATAAPFVAAAGAGFMAVLAAF